MHDFQHSRYWPPCPPSYPLVEVVEETPRASEPSAPLVNDELLCWMGDEVKNQTGQSLLISEDSVARLTALLRDFSAKPGWSWPCSTCKGPPWAQPCPECCSTAKPRRVDHVPASVEDSAAARAMLPPEVLRVAVVVRAVLEELQSTNQGLNWGPGLSGACDIGSATLARALRARGWNAVFVTGKYHDGGVPAEHCWVELFNEDAWVVLDVTATQFSQLPPIHVQTCPTAAYVTTRRNLAAHHLVRIQWWSGNELSRGRLVRRVTAQVRRQLAANTETAP